MDELIDRLGGTSAVARMAGVEPPSVTAWRKRGIPSERCPAIERATEGRTTCEEMRPDVVWQRVPDPAWPHKDGRPCIDVAPPELVGTPGAPEPTPAAAPAINLEAAQA